MLTVRQTVAVPVRKVRVGFLTVVEEQCRCYEFGTPAHAQDQTHFCPKAHD